MYFAQFPCTISFSFFFCGARAFVFFCVPTSAIAVRKVSQSHTCCQHSSAQTVKGHLRVCVCVCVSTVVRKKQNQLKDTYTYRQIGDERRATQTQMVTTRVCRHTWTDWSKIGIINLLSCQCEPKPLFWPLAELILKDQCAKCLRKPA